MKYWHTLQRGWTLKTVRKKERSQTHKATQRLILFVGKSMILFVVTESKSVVTKDWAGRDVEWLLMGVESLFVVIKSWN